MLGIKSVASAVTSDNSYRLFDDMPISIMLCELGDFRITYINESTRQNLKKIEHVLPVKVDALIGQSIDIFHKNPQHQRRLLSDPKNLPHKARITIGGETLDLTVTAMTNSRGRYSGPMLTWELATEKARLETQTERLLQMLDNMPINIMMCDTDFNITYINQTSLKTLDTVKHLLPVRPDQILGNSFDIFHKNPAHQRRIIGDPKNLPHAAKIKLGPETLDLRVSGLMDKRGNYTGAMLSWSVVTGNIKLADDFERDVKGLAGMLSSASTQMQGTARSLTTTAEFVNQRSASAASASEELSSSVNEISRQVTEASRIARMAVEEAEKSDKLVAGLVTMAQKIGDVVALINQIADALEEFDNNIEIRASVLAAQGKAFCAGANFGDPARQEQEERAKSDPASNLPINHLYVQAVRIFRNKKPIVAAIHGAAIGGGLGLAVSADFRVACPEARFAANFTKLGFHPGFGLTTTLPELIGKNNAELMFYTSRRVTGEEAYRWGLANVLVPQDQVRAEAMKLAQEIAECSPLGLVSTRATMRAGLADRVLAATNHELEEQTKLRATEDFKEGVKATAERRVANFKGR